MKWMVLLFVGAASVTRQTYNSRVWVYHRSNRILRMYCIIYLYKIAIIVSLLGMPSVVSLIEGGSGYCKYGWSKYAAPSGRCATFLVSCGDQRPGPRLKRHKTPVNITITSANLQSSRLMFTYLQSKKICH